MLISTYEMGRQPFGLASPAAWLRQGGAQVTCLDVSREAFREDAIREADLVAFYVPMHTATRLAVQWIEPVRKLNPRAHICFYGLYASMNEEYLRGLGVHSILGGEFEAGLAHLAARLRSARANGSSAALEQTEPVLSLARLRFQVPDRSNLVALAQYAHLVVPGGAHRTVGYTEASRGCKHLCRHCPIVPVYNGTFRIVDLEVVLADIRQQVAAGASHITFGDPDFFNGIGHALAIADAVHREHPQVTYDVTIKIEHLRKYQKHLPALRDTGCLFVTSAVESVDDTVLEHLDKGHTRADFLGVIEDFRELGLTLQPTFVPFTPWTTLDGYLDLLRVLKNQGLEENVAPIQLGIRLLIPAGSRLLELPDVRGLAGAFDPQALVHPWRHPDARVDALCTDVQGIIAAAEKLKRGRSSTFGKIWQAAAEAAGMAGKSAPQPMPMLSRAAIPYLNEPWYC
ncbi:MAG TPA: CUAEP/CCAEP-tail radical SAM protein [Candidatus Acidoferrales bacterium]|nr:CUAEP/CCAEP-tail radical SAM protein [Candidatus Acidoferrales bacterium]